MNDQEYDSDTSDDDYVPDGKVEEAVSEVDSDGDPEDLDSGSEGESVSKGRKRTKKVSRTKKKAKVEKTEPEASEDTKEKHDISEEEKKKTADDLWADFMKDTGFQSKNSKVEPSSSTETNKQQSTTTKKDENKVTEKPSSKVKITQIFEFAGEEVKVEKEVDANSAKARILSKEKPETSRPKKVGGLSGIGNVLSQLGKKQKISTLEKTKLDWDRFKKDENIEEELQIHNKGKDGYLDRQDFLQRADLRRFEIEKNIRNVERAKRFNSAL